MEKNYSNFSDFAKDYKYDEENDKIGEGGFATVYRADDMIRHREVAVKVSKVRKDERYSLKHEFEVVKSFPIHPNVAYYESCHRFKIAGVGLYDLAIMDYYPLGNLENVMQEQNLDKQQIHSIIGGILSAIEFLHNNDAIHRDIKPSNILMAKFSNRYVPKIADFGLGKIMETNEGQSSIENSFIGGSINYAAPEQILGTKIRPNVDLWSFGVLLYKVCVGELPFLIDESTTSTSVRRERLIKKIVNAQIPEKVNEVPEPFQSIIRKCLVVDADQRVKSATELLVILNFERDLNEANQAFENKEVDEALTKYESLLVSNPNNEFIKKRITEIGQLKNSNSKIEQIERLVLAKNYQEALEASKDLSESELKQLEIALNEAKTWVEEEKKAQTNIEKGDLAAAISSFEKLEANSPNKYKTLIENHKKQLETNNFFDEAEALFVNKKYAEAAAIYAKIEQIYPPKDKILKEHQDFTKKFVDLLNEANKLKNEKKWKLAINKFEELLKLSGDKSFEAQIDDCDFELNRTVIIKPVGKDTAPPPTPQKPNPEQVVTLPKEKIPEKDGNKSVIDDYKTILVEKEKPKENPNKESDKKTFSTTTPPPAAPKKNNIALFVAIGIAALLVVAFFIFKNNDPKPEPTPVVVQPTVDIKAIQAEMQKAEAKFTNGEYKEFATIILEVKQKYKVDSTLPKAQQLANKIKDFELDINKDEFFTDKAKELCAQSLRLDPINTTALRVKKKYNF